MRIEFTVYGQAQPAGSKRGFAFKRKNGTTGVAISDANPKSGEWKRYVKLAASNHRPDKLILGAVAVSFTFVRVRPAGHFRKSRGQITTELNTDGLARPYPTSKPDAVKLTRGFEDALTGIIWVDDNQNVDVRSRKIWGETACVQVVIEALEDQTALYAAPPKPARRARIGLTPRLPNGFNGG
jgi:Holliday junction resolvase RusA-like endonuclease